MRDWVNENMAITNRTNAFMSKLFFVIAEHMLLNLGVEIK